MPHRGTEVLFCDRRQGTCTFASGLNELYLPLHWCRYRKGKRVDSGGKEKRSEKKRFAAKPAGGPLDYADADHGDDHTIGRHARKKKKDKEKEARHHPAVLNGRDVPDEAAVPVIETRQEQAQGREEYLFALPW